MEQILKKIYKSRIFGLISILFFIAVCMGIGAFAAYVKHVSNPTEQAVTYFRAFMQQDYDTMYNLLDKKDGYYISKDRYKEIMQKTRESMTIDSYKINDPRKEDGQYVVTIECTDDETDSSQNMNIYLNKKMHLPKLKPDYKVDIEKMLVKNLTIKIPQGDKLTIAGIEITDKDANITTENNVQIYNFKAILNGNYKIPMGAFLAATLIPLAVELPFSMLQKDAQPLPVTIMFYVAEFLITLLSMVLSVGM